jgi:hypothetical protein
MKMKKKLITIITLRGDRNITATLVTPELAVHNTISENGIKRGFFSITHVPTGCAIFHNIHGRAFAIGAARELTKIKGWDTPNLHAEKAKKEFKRKNLKELLRIKKLIKEHE